MEEYKDTFPNGYALVVGIGKYEDDQLTVLQTANDAEDVAAVLKDRNFCAYEDENVIEICREDATRSRIEQELKKLYEKINNEDPSATVILFFSGHGMLKQDTGEYYFLPYETKLQRSKDNEVIDIKDENTVLPNSVLKRYFKLFLDNSFVQRFVLIVNTCYSGALAVPLSAPSVKQKLNVESRGIPLSTYDDLTKGKGRCVIASSWDDKESWVLKGDRNSLLSRALISALRGDAGRPAESLIRILDLCSYIDDTIKKDSGSKLDQVPLYTLDRADNFPIARKNPYTCYMSTEQFLIDQFSLEQLQLQLEDFERTPIIDNSKARLARRLIENWINAGVLRDRIKSLRKVFPYDKTHDLLSEDELFIDGEEQYDHWLRGKVGKDYESIKCSYIRNLNQWTQYDGLKESSKDDQIRKTASKETIDTLENLDGVNRSWIVRRLYKEEVINKISLRTSNLSETSLNNFDFAGIDLRDANLSKANLCGSKLNKSDLRESDLRNAILEGVDLSGAQLQSAKLQGANLRGANLSSADLSDAKLQGANLRGADLSKADLREAHLEGANLLETKIEFVNLRRSTISADDSKIRKIIDKKLLDIWKLQNGKSDDFELDKDFSGADLCDTDLRNVNFEDAILDQAKLSNAKLNQVKMQRASLRYTNLSGADLCGAHLEEAIFDHTNLSGANLSEAHLNEARFHHADLPGALLIGSILKNSYIIETNLEEAQFIRVDNWAKLRQSINDMWSKLRKRDTDDPFFGTANWGENAAQLTGTSIIGSRLGDAVVSTAQLKNTRILFKTLLPNGQEYNSREGVIRVITEREEISNESFLPVFLPSEDKNTVRLIINETDLPSPPLIVKTAEIYQWPMLSERLTSTSETEPIECLDDGKIIWKYKMDPPQYVVEELDQRRSSDLSSTSTHSKG